MLDVTFVDDECVVLVATIPALLKRAVDILLETLLGVFSRCHLELSWEPGKTEAIIKFRGDGAVAARESYRMPDGKMGIPLTKYGYSSTLRFVDEYKHLGSIIDAHGMSFMNVASHVRNAMAAYAPLAYKLFGSRLIQQRYRLLFLRSLVLSRLLHNMHIFSLHPRALKRLNGVWMRGLRRILGDMRFSSDVSFTDLEVRRQLGADSIDCILLVARMLYLGRVVRERPRSPLAVLHMRCSGKPLPWVEHVRRDAAFLVTEGFLPDMPAFDADPDKWVQKMATRDSWKSALDSVHFAESACDTVKVESSLASGRALTFECPQCACAFASARARDSHIRAKHGVRSPFRERIATSICPCCGVDFRQRVRLLNHLGDKRRPRCATFVLAHCPLLSPERVASLDQDDRLARRSAQRAGRSQIRAVEPALRADGRVCGVSIAA